MCGPLALGIVGAVSSIGGAVVGQIQTNSANAENAELFAQSAALSSEGIANEYSNLHLRNISDEGASNQTIQDLIRDSAEGQSASMALAADSGVSGASVAALFQEFEHDKGVALALETRNKKLRLAEMQQQKTSLHTRTKASLLGVVPATIQGPDIIGSVGKGLGALGQGIAAQRKADAGKTNTKVDVTNK